jgi:hypothetical protein
MDPVQYLLHLIEQGVLYEDARSHTRQRFGLSDDDLSLRLRLARKDANALLRSLDALPKDAWA